MPVEPDRARARRALAAAGPASFREPQACLLLRYCVGAAPACLGQELWGSSSSCTHTAL